MPGTPTSKYAIPTFAAGGTDPVNTGHTQINSALATVDANMAGYTTGTLAARPAAGKAGLIYRATDTGQVFLDIGSAWVELARPAADMGAYRSVTEAEFQFGSTHVVGTHAPSAQGGAIIIGGGGGGITGTYNFVPLVPADYAVAGLTTQFRIQAATITNTVPPAANFTFGLSTITGLGGSSGLLAITNISASVASVTRSAPGATASFIDSTADFTIPGTGVYLLTVAISSALAANSHTECKLRLQVHNV